MRKIVDPGQWEYEEDEITKGAGVLDDTSKPKRWAKRDFARLVLVKVHPDSAAESIVRRNLVATMDRELSVPVRPLLLQVQHKSDCVCFAGASWVSSKRKSIIQTSTFKLSEGLKSVT